MKQASLTDLRTQYVHPPLRWMLMLAMISAIGPMAIDMYLPSLPALQRHFHSDTAATQLTLSAFFIGLACGQIMYGPVSDRFGRKPPLLFGLGLFTLVSLACVFAPSIEALTLLRFAQALGGAGGMVIVRAIIRDRYPPQDMARVLSLLLLVMGVAPILAPLAGGWVFQWWGWQAIFIVLTAYGALCFAAVACGLTETIVDRAPALRMSAIAIGYGRMLAHRRFLGYALAGGVAQGGMFAYISASPFVFIDFFGLSPTHYGWVFGTNALGLISASQINTRVLRRLPAQQVLRRAIRSYAGFGLLLLLCAWRGWGGVWGVLIPLVCCISSLGFTFPNSTAAAMAPFGDRAGSASALLGTLQFAIAACTGALVGHLLRNSAVPMAAVIAGCGCTSAALLAWVRPHESHKPVRGDS
ncbi:MAG TPA: Bcr/CflA family multidrug efflux MFS transporter [Nevskiaceae bacterium]|nr:Bcr/CflA family multidrug efflux MFS transporter [Nevskiaceae bacterium]